MENSKPDIIRKPILTTSCRRNARNHPEFLDTESLLERFEPLLRSVHKKFCSYDGVFNNSDDISDLWNHIVYEFLRLRTTYDPKRGVDFPGYIKIHLQQRVYHYVMKTQKVGQKEQSISSLGDGSEDSWSMELENTLELVDENSEEEMERVERVASVPWKDIKDPEKARFIHAVLIQRKDTVTIAKEWQVSQKYVKQLLEDCCELLKQIHENGGE